MLKTSGMISFAAGALLLVPTAQEGPVTSLEQALERTVQGIEEISGYKQRIQSSGEDSRTAIRALLRSTEVSNLDEGAREEKIFSLRDEINRLQISFDAAMGGTQRPDLQAAVLAPLGGGSEADEPARPVLPTGATNSAFSGMDSSMKELLESIHPESPDAETGTGAMGSATASGAAASKVSLPAGYSANPVRQARACYKAGLYQRGLDAVSKLDDDWEAVYWKARLLEMLDRPEEAIEAYTDVIESSKAEDKSLSARAQSDLEFLRWRTSFERDEKRGSTGGKTL